MTEAHLPSEYGWLPRENAKIYPESSGNPDGVPLVYLHGGPGGSLGSGGSRC